MIGNFDALPGKMDGLEEVHWARSGNMVYLFRTGNKDNKWNNYLNRVNINNLRITEFGAEIGANKFQPTGTYTINVTMTATTL